MSERASQTQWDDLLEGPEASEPRKFAAGTETEQRLSAYMTHELRAPLTSIRSALALMQSQLDSRLETEERQVLSLAIKNTDRLNNLISDILDYEKLRAGKMTVERTALHPEHLMLEAAESLRSWAVSKGVRLICTASSEPLPRVFADRRRTVQVIINLISNAIKFTPAGGRVELSAALGSYEHAGTVLFKVKDTGPGIPGKDLENIFNCFEQSALGIKTSQGTGLGLTLSRLMVERQGGRIWAESWRGLGASLFFTLPAHAPDVARPVQAYPQPIEYHGLIINISRRLNSFVTALFA
ncbi:MAG: HAMP domain-containing sensor histidine kinase [Elusimicrobiota bacterium]|jgi:signal transduction histidine kinase